MELELCDGHGVSFGGGLEGRVGVCLLQYIWSCVSGTLDSAAGEGVSGGNGLLTSERLDGLSQGRKSDNVINKGNDISDFRRKGVWLGDARDHDISSNGRTEKSKLSLKHGFGNFYRHFNMDNISIFGDTSIFSSDSL